MATSKNLMFKQSMVVVLQKFNFIAINTGASGGRVVCEGGDGLSVTL